MIRIKDLIRETSVLINPDFVQTIELVTKSNSDHAQLMLVDYLSVMMKSGQLFCVKEMDFTDTVCVDCVTTESLKC